MIGNESICLRRSRTLSAAAAVYNLRHANTPAGVAVDPPPPSPRNSPIATSKLKPDKLAKLLAIICSICLLGGSTGLARAARMVRLCIASVDPVKLSSQCVMCNRREFPLTVIDCTGMNRVNDLIANPLSVQEATCLIYNCRRQVPDISPEPYHGAMANSIRGYQAAASAMRNYGVMPPNGMFGGSFPGGFHNPSRYGHFSHAASSAVPLQTAPGAAAVALLPLNSLMGGLSLLGSRNKLESSIPYAFVPATQSSLLGNDMGLRSDLQTLTTPKYLGTTTTRKPTTSKPFKKFQEIVTAKSTSTTTTTTGAPTTTTSTSTSTSTSSAPSSSSTTVEPGPISSTTKTPKEVQNFAKQTEILDKLIKLATELLANVNANKIMNKRKAFQLKFLMARIRYTIKYTTKTPTVLNLPGMLDIS